MSKSTVECDRYTCDGCGAHFDVEQGDEPPHGFHGQSVVQIAEWGGTGVNEWYACKPNCIRKAVENAIKGDDRD